MATIFERVRRAVVEALERPQTFSPQQASVPVVLTPQVWTQSAHEIPELQLARERTRFAEIAVAGRRPRGVRKPRDIERLRAVSS